MRYSLLLSLLLLNGCQALSDMRFRDRSEREYLYRELKENIDIKLDAMNEKIDNTRCKCNDRL